MKYVANYTEISNSSPKNSTPDRVPALKTVTLINLIEVILKIRKSSKMHTADLETVHASVSVATTRCHSCGAEGGGVPK